MRILKATGVKFEWEKFAVGAGAYEKFDEYIPKDLTESIELTRDIGGKAGTSEFADAVIEEMQKD